MPRITVAPAAQYPDSIYATFLFVESITVGAKIIAKIFYDDGSSSELQEVVSGSKFLQGDKGQRIEKVLFRNEGALSCDIEYRYSTIFGYDEARLIGDVNALIRTDNLTEIGHEYIGGAEAAPEIGKYQAAGVSNPAGSGVNLIVRRLLVECETGKFYVHGTDQPGAVDVTTLLHWKHNKKIGNPNGQGRIVVRSELAVLNSITIMALGTSSINKQPVALHFKSEPLIIPPGKYLAVAPADIGSGILATIEWAEEEL